MSDKPPPAAHDGSEGSTSRLRPAAKASRDALARITERREVFAALATIFIVAAAAVSLALVVSTSHAPVSEQVLSLFQSESRVAYTLVSAPPTGSATLAESAASGVATGASPLGTQVIDGSLAQLSTPGVPGSELCWVIALQPPAGALTGALGQAINYDVVVVDARSGTAIERWTGYSPLVKRGATELSSLASSLTPPSRAFSSPGLIAANAAITIAVILFITFPSQIFNRAFEEGYDDLRESWERRFPKARDVRDRVTKSGGVRRNNALFSGMILVGALLGSALSPNFGLNAGSLVDYASMLLALSLSIAVPAGIAFVYRRLRHKPHTFRLHALPAGLAVAVICVVVSRLADFQPGYLYGLVCGVVFGGKLAKNEGGHVVGLSYLATLAVSVIAWFAWVPAHSSASGAGSSLVAVLIGDFLAAAFVSGLVGSVFSLLPLRSLPGKALMDWHRGAWTASFALTLFLLVQVMLRPVTGPTHPGGAPIATAVVLFVVFGGLSIGLRLRVGRRQHETAEPEPALATAAAAVIADGGPGTSAGGAAGAGGTAPGAGPPGNDSSDGGSPSPGEAGTGSQGPT